MNNNLKSLYEDFKEYFSVLPKYSIFILNQFLTGRNKAGLPFLILGVLFRFFKGDGIDQRKIIHSTDWDILVILDACRYDYFIREYDKFFRGKVIKALSPASGTHVWLKRVFSEQYPNIQVFSANPYLNSKNVEIGGYKAIRHFTKTNIHDIWEYGWDKKLKTVHPKRVLEEVIKKGDNSKKWVIWFIQPHGPWIGEPRLLTSSSKKLEGNDEAIVALIRQGKISNDELIQAYRGNLKLVLKYVAFILETYQNKNILITSDHGELLGEYGSYLHYTFLTCPCLREVPLVFRKKQA